MSIEAIEQAETNREAALLATTDNEQAQRRVALWALPFMADHLVAEALDIAHSSWGQLKRDGDTPPLFTIGRRLFVRTADLREWLDGKAAQGKPGSKPRRIEAGK